MCRQATLLEFLHSTFSDKPEKWLGSLVLLFLKFNSITFFWCFSHLSYAFLGERNGISVSSFPITRVGLVREIVEYKESRIGKQPIQVPSNVTISLEGQDLKVKGPLGELALTYPREVKLDREESGILRVRTAVDTRRANHGP
ncbi:hypothetical protein CRYUN_Cryun21dG0027000 [Craigia yunnanensis]